VCRLQSWAKSTLHCLVQSLCVGCNPEPVQPFCLVQSICEGRSPEPVQPLFFSTVNLWKPQFWASSTLYCLVQSLILIWSPEPVLLYTVWYSQFVKVAVLSQFYLIRFGTVNLLRLHSWASSTLYCLVQSLCVGCSPEPVQPYTVWYSHCVWTAILSQFNLFVWYSQFVKAAVLSHFYLILFDTVTACKLQSWTSSTLYSSQNWFIWPTFVLQTLLQYLPGHCDGLYDYLTYQIAVTVHTCHSFAFQVYVSRGNATTNNKQIDIGY